MSCLCRQLCQKVTDQVFPRFSFALYRLPLFHRGPTHAKLSPEGTRTLSAANHSSLANLEYSTSEQTDQPTTNAPVSVPSSLTLLPHRHPAEGRDRAWPVLNHRQLALAKTTTTTIDDHTPELEPHAPLPSVPSRYCTASTRTLGRDVESEVSEEITLADAVGPPSHSSTPTLQSSRSNSTRRIDDSASPRTGLGRYVKSEPEERVRPEEGGEGRARVMERTDQLFVLVSSTADSLSNPAL